MSKIHGVFIGIDRYASPAVNWLSCAEKDAQALHALFADNLPGDNLKLLTGDEATHSAIDDELKRLSKCKPDDVVIFTFSGHGTETHELVAHDTDPANLAGTTIPLGELSKSFAKIPARRLICILDCCFSGGLGAKALQVDVTPRDAASGEELLKQMAGVGRVILTASLATERAWEHQKLGHGLLTHFVLEALKGAEEVRKNGKVGIYRLLEYVTTNVADSAKLFGEEQHPMLLGRIEKEITLPIFKPGKLYIETFPDSGPKKAKADVKSLVGLGFPEGLVKAWAGSSITKLNQLQLDAINDFGLLNNEHLVVSAPTSSGKTLIGELAALRGVVEKRRTLFLLPLKALVNDKLRHFEETYGEFGLRTIRATGESTSDDILPLMRGQYDICLMTYEKFSAMVLSSPHILDQVGTIIIDEVQMIADKSRGANLEFLLTLLRVRRRQGIEPQLIALSAVIGDTNGLERWMDARLLRRDERPIPLDEGTIGLDGRFRYVESDTGDEKEIKVVKTEYRKGSAQDVIIPLVHRLVTEGKSVIVFRETKPQAKAVARYLAHNLALPAAQTTLDSLPNTDPSVSSQDLRETLAGGVAFHIADLGTEERRIVEEQFRASSSALKVIVATTTLAMGVNTPTEAVIIAGLMHPGGEPYSVAEYKNIVGRAGRLGYAERGTAYVVVKNPNEEQTVWQDYVKANPEDLFSRFFSENTDPRSLVMRVLAAMRSKRGLTADEIIEFLEESFGSYQEKYKNPAWAWDKERTASSIEELSVHGLIEQDKESFYHPTLLGRLAGESGLEVESILRIIDALRGMEATEVSDPALIALSQITTELDQVYFPLNKRGAQKESQTWTSEISGQNIPGAVFSAMNRSVRDIGEAALRVKRTAACLFWITDMQMLDIEAALMRHLPSKAASGNVLSVSARTCDVLPTVASIAEILNPGLDFGARIERLLVRLELGIPAESVELGSIFGKTLNRGEYLALLNAGITTKEAFEGAGEDALLGCLENNQEKLTALRIRLEERAMERGAEAVAPSLPKYKA